jgi:hypothetical protein
MKKWIASILFSAALASAGAALALAAVTEPQPPVQTAPPLQPPAQATKPSKLTSGQEAALAEVRKILREARQMAESIELPSRLTTRGMVLKDLQASKDRLINEVEEAQFRIGDFSTAATTKRPWYLVFAQVKYGKIQEAVATAAKIKLGVETLFPLVKMLADAGYLDAAIKVAETDLVKEQVTSNRYLYQSVVWALIASEQAKVGDPTSRASLERALKAAKALSDPKRFKPLEERILAWVHVAKAQAAMGDQTGSTGSFRQAIEAALALREVQSRPVALIQVGKAQLEVGQSAAGDGTLQQAIQLAATWEPSRRGGLLCCLAWTKSVTGNEHGVRQLLDQAVSEIKDLPPSHRVRVLHDLGKWQLGLHQQEAAARTVRLMKEAAEAIEEEREKVEALGLARSFATRAGEVPTALALLDVSPDGYEKLEAMRYLATVLVTAQERDGIHPPSVIKRLAQEAPVLAKNTTFKDEVKARFAQKAVAVIEAAAGELDGALKTIEGLSDDFKGGYVYPEIIQLLTKQGNLAGAKQVAADLKEDWVLWGSSRSNNRDALRNLAKVSARSEAVQETLVWAKRLLGPYAQPYAMLGVADALLEQHQFENIDALLPRTPLRRSCPSVLDLLN